MVAVSKAASARCLVAFWIYLLLFRNYLPISNTWDFFDSKIYKITIQNLTAAKLFLYIRAFMVLEIFYEINDVTGVLTPYFDTYFWQLFVNTYKNINNCYYLSSMRHCTVHRARPWEFSLSQKITIVIWIFSEQLGPN